MQHAQGAKRKTKHAKQNTEDNIEQTKKQDKMQNDKHARITDNK